MYIYHKEFKEFNFTVLKQRSTYELAGNAFVIAILLQSSFNFLAKFIFHTEITNMSMQMFNIPIVPVYAVVLAPILEELIFRKIIFGTLDKRFNFWIGSIVSSALFAAAHMSIPLFIGYFAVGMVFCFFYKKTRSITIVVLSHTYINFLVVLSKSILLE